MGKCSKVMLVQWNQTGGSPRFLFELAKAWHKEAPGQVAWSYNTFADNVAAYRSLPIPALEVTTYKRTKLGIIIGIPRLLQLGFQLRRFATLRSVDTYISVMPNIFQSLVAPLVLPKSVQYVACVHDAEAHPGDKDNAIYSLLLRLELWRADKVIVFSDAVKNQLTRKHPELASDIVRTVHPAWNARDAAHARVRSLERNHPVTVGFFGRLFPYKGLDLLLDAARILRQRKLNVRIEVHGEGPDGELEDSASDIPGMWNIGWIDDTDIERIVNGFDILALPYKEASQSGVFAQAVALGIPSVATPVGGLREQLEETGAGVVTDTISATGLADAIELLINDPTLYARMSRSALTASQVTHSWQRVVNDLTMTLNVRNPPHSAVFADQCQESR